MITAIRKRLEDKDEGFTLIELLVVVIIIGILAAIAIPVFLSQRQRAYERTAEADSRNAALAVESFFTQDQLYPANDTWPAGPTTLTSGDVVTVSTNVTLDYRQVDGLYCIEATHALLDAPGPHATYDSGEGGIVAACVSAP